MAPKAPAKAPAKPAAKAPATPAKDAKAEPAAPAAGGTTGGGAGTGSAPPKNKEEVLAQVNLDGLPHCPNEQIIEILKERYETLVSVFIHYSKQSECKTIEQATRLRLGARAPRLAPAVAVAVCCVCEAPCSSVLLPCWLPRHLPRRP